MSRLKSLSRVGTTVIECQGSAEGVIACSVFDTHRHFGPQEEKYNPFVGNIGHFDNEINLARLGAWKA